MDERRGASRYICRARSATADTRDGRRTDQYSEVVTRVTLFKESKIARLLYCLGVRLIKTRYATAL
jgi:hypothetical protein